MRQAITMKRSSWSILLILLPVAAVADSTSFESRDLEKLIVEVADFSEEFAWPEGRRVMHFVAFCEKRDRSAPRTGKKSCYVGWYAHGLRGNPGFIQFSDRVGTESPDASHPWFRLTTEWDSKLRVHFLKLAHARFDALIPPGQQNPGNYPPGGGSRTMPYW